jgi:beta-glucanase (GH16 family)
MTRAVATSILFSISFFLQGCKHDDGFVTPVPTTGYTTPTAYAGMSLLWADEFSDNTLDSKWKFETGDGCPAVCGWGNNELEYYREQNIKFQNGYLILEAKSETFRGKNFTSSKLVTKGNVSFKYGRVDVRSVLPEGQGIWPAIWMLGSNIDAVGWPNCGEVDIMEMIGGNGRENTVYGTAHWDNAGNYASYGGHYTLPEGTFKDQFHVFSITWDPNKITWYVDDIKYHEIDITPAALSEFQKEFYFIVNIAVGGNWPGNPSGTTAFPQRMMVDYIRVFQKV